jgi:hypothetical protein
MAETQKASTGWGGSVLLHDGTALYELVEVVSFGLPSDTSDRVETTHLKSPNRRRQYTSGLIDSGEVEVVLNFRPGSTTDLLLETALVDGDERAAKFVIPELGVPTRQYTATVVVTAYDKGSVTADGKLEATATFALSGAITSAAYSA